MEEVENSKSKTILNLFKKEIMEKDALNRIKFDPSLNPKEFEILYIDRDKKINTLTKLSFSELILEGDFFKIKDKNTLIPLHRIRKILWKGKVVWDKRRI